MRPVVNRLEDEFKDRVVFRVMNALDGGDGEAAFKQLGLRGHPGYVILAPGGTEVYRNLGVVEESALREVIQAALDSG